MNPRALLPWALAACAPEPGEGGPGETVVALLVPSALEPVDAALDPLLPHRPEDVDCPPAAWGEEGGGFEVQTGVCAYAAFDQPLEARLVEGDRLEINVWHDTLDSLEPGDGHVAVLLGDRVVWEETVAVPAPSAALDAVIVLDFRPADDARLGLHLHNHGFNSWRFVQVQATLP